MKKTALFLVLAIFMVMPAFCQTANVLKLKAGDKLVGNLNVPSGGTLTIAAGASIINNGTATGFAGAVAWGGITGTLSNQTDLQTALNAKSPLAGSTSLVTAGHLSAIDFTGDGAAITGLQLANITGNEYDFSSGSSTFAFTCPRYPTGSGIFKVTAAGTVQVGDIAGSVNHTLFLVDDTNSLIQMTAGGQVMVWNTSGLNLNGASIINAVWNGTALVNSKTTATSSNVFSAIVARDSSGNFSAGTITAALTGTASGNEVPLTFSNSLNRSTNTITLVNDSATPGNSKYYGTDSGGTKGWNALPAAFDPTAPGPIGGTTPSTGAFTTTTLTPANNATGLTLTGGSITGSGTTPFQSITGTWNTSGNPSAVLVNLVKTGVGADYSLLDFQFSGTRFVRIARASSNDEPALLANGSGGLQIGNDQGSLRVVGDGGSGTVFFQSTLNNVSFSGLFGGDLSGTFNFNGTGAINFGPNGAAKMTVGGTTGNVGIGGNPNANALLDVQSTTKAFLPPRMTTTQKNAIASPAEGMVVYDTTLHKLSVYTGSAWETVTSL